VQGKLSGPKSPYTVKTFVPWLHIDVVDWAKFTSPPAEGPIAK
jgi:hypothetical protein